MNGVFFSFSQVLAATVNRSCYFFFFFFCCCHETRVSNLMSMQCTKTVQDQYLEINWLQKLNNGTENYKVNTMILPLQFSFFFRRTFVLCKQIIKRKKCLFRSVFTFSVTWLEIVFKVSGERIWEKRQHLRRWKKKNYQKWN